ncbi:DUF6192 family protein [Sphaerisporangium fuscum]|uniref:DUF6192 family protein n=1 Tax=Sphaerisporangium fuscum TaxID=2835868 RepID=UPI001BDC2481|nr:DUF6192 family protein [Sphaerisporangium fuscum]
MASKVGNVTQRRFDNLVDHAQDLVQTMTNHQFAIGDMALEIEPMRRTRMGQDDGIYASLRTFADEIGEVFDTVRGWRWVADAWPADQRCDDASYSVHRVMASHPDRFTLIREAPVDRRGRRHWTVDAAAKAVGRGSNCASADAQSRTASPEAQSGTASPDSSAAPPEAQSSAASPDPHSSAASRDAQSGTASPDPLSGAEAVQQIRVLASDDAVASTVAAEFLSRPEVASRVMADPNTRRQLYRAQRDHDQQVQDAARERTPAIKHVEHSIHFLELLSTGHAFVTGIKRLMPQIQTNPLTRQERDVMHHVLDQAQAAVDFCRSVIDTGTMDEELVKFFDEEGEP